MFNHWVTILVTIAAVGGAIVTIYGWIRAPIRWWRSRKKKVLSFAQNDVFWTIGKLDDQSEPVTLVIWPLARNEQFRSRRKDHERKIEQVCTSIRSARYA